VRMLNEHFRTTEDFFKDVKHDPELIKMLKARYSGDRRVFFNSGPGPGEFREKIDLFDFKSYDEAYHQLMIELADLTTEAINLILPQKDDIGNIYITGGFSRNKIFISLMTRAFPLKKVYTSEINNGTALGAALVLLSSLGIKQPALNLGLTESTL